MEHLSGYELYDYISAGAQKVIYSETILNSINVYPVADSDTGSNLAYTMKCILAGATRNANASESIHSISMIALEDAYGNSGTIFASYFYGLSTVFKGKRNLTIEEFAVGAHDAVQYAYDALAKPTEGTILTVMRSWGEYLQDHYKLHNDFKSLFTAASSHAKKALLETRYQLKVLTDSQVVDAGALGFIYFLEGIAEYMKNGHVTKKSAQRLHPPHTHDYPHDHPDSLLYRYCTEFMVEATQTIDKEILLNALSESADSIIVQNIGKLYKIHVHTNTPAHTASLLTPYGMIIKSKVDDMKTQVLFGQQGRKPIGILTDSIACVPESLKDSGLVYITPLQLILDGHTYVDGLTLKNTALFKNLKQSKHPATSSQVSEATLRKTMEMMLTHFDQVIALFVSSEMSGMYQRMLQVMGKIENPRVHVIDSLSNTAAQGLMVSQAISMIQNGFSAQQIVSHITDQRSAFRIYVEIPDLEYATISGRVPKIIGFIAGLFNLKAVISIDQNGKGIVTAERSLVNMVEKLKKSGCYSKLSFVYTGTLDQHIDKIRLIEKKLQLEAVFIEEASNIISAFIGEGALGLAIVEV